MSAISIGDMIAGALSLTAALAWNDAAKSGIDAAIPNVGKNAVGMLVYAVLVTVVVIMIARGWNTAKDVVNGVHEKYATAAPPRGKNGGAAAMRAA